MKGGKAAGLVALYFWSMRYGGWMIILMLSLAGPARCSGPFLVAEVITQATLDSLDRLAPGEEARVAGENTRLVGSVLAVALGPFGAHRLYLGTTPRVAVFYGITFGGFGVLALMDLGHLLFSQDLAPYRDNSRVFMWSGTASTPP